MIPQNPGYFWALCKLYDHWYVGYLIFRPDLSSTSYKFYTGEAYDLYDCVLCDVMFEQDEIIEVYDENSR